MINTEYIIVGQGLAGTLLSFELFKQKKDFIVVDENIPVTSSKVAPGMFTPISGKRMTKSPGTDELINIAFETYREIEKLLSIELIHIKNIYTVFGSVKEQNDLMLKSENKDFFQHINTEPEIMEQTVQPFGAFEITGSGWINISLLLDKFKDWLIENNVYIEEKFDYSAIEFSENKILYKNMVCEKIIFCEGWKASSNSFFPTLPFNLCKGDILTIECKGLPVERILKKGVYILPLGQNIFKVGSTYIWNDPDETPNEKSKNILEDKLKQLINLPFKILNHQSGIRPTTITREPVFIQHHKFKNMFLLNGLGTKGVVTGPWWVKNNLLKIKS